MSLLKFIYLIVALICVLLGTLGIFIPVLPTTPFYLLAAFLFTKSSKKLEIWFINTSMYKKHMIKIKEKKALTIKEKLTILLPLSLVMGVGLFFMRELLYPSIILIAIWLIHIIYFGFVLKTEKYVNNQIED
jgi:uncharacterized membrane protein YbaN (DUF454 family)